MSDEIKRYSPVCAMNLMFAFRMLDGDVTVWRMPYIFESAEAEAVSDIVKHPESSIAVRIKQATRFRAVLLCIFG